MGKKTHGVAGLKKNEKKSLIPTPPAFWTKKTRKLTLLPAGTEAERQWHRYRHSRLRKQEKHLPCGTFTAKNGNLSLSELQYHKGIGNFIENLFLFFSPRFFQYLSVFISGLLSHTGIVVLKMAKAQSLCLYSCTLKTIFP